MATVTALANAIAGLSFSDLDDDLIESARKRVFDTLGATAVGLHTEEGQQLRRLFVRMTAGIDATGNIIENIRLYVGATRATEIDDIDIRSCTTVGSVIVPVALAIAAARSDVPDRTVLLSIICGYEAMIRLGRAIDGAEILYRGVWPTYVTAPFAAAAAAAKLLELDARTTAQALLMALSRSTSLPSGTRGLAHRQYALGCAAAEGYVACQAAASGFTLDDSILKTFGRVIGVPFDGPLLDDDPGNDWKIAEPDVKYFATARQALAGIEAFLQLVSTDNTADDIEQVIVWIPSQYQDMIDRPNWPISRLESLLSQQYQLALAAVKPEQLYDTCRQPISDDRETMLSLMSRISIVSDPGLTRSFPEQWGSRVTVKWRSGTESSADIMEPFGSGKRDLEWLSLVRKLERIIPEVRHGEGVPDLQKLYRECRAMGQIAGGRTAAGLLSKINLMSDIN